jgi:glycosyltransferase involved in cell wall biosynthesis
MARVSAPEIAERLRHRVELQRQRLQMSRRDLATWMYLNRHTKPGWIRTAVRIWAALLRRTRLDRAQAARQVQLETKLQGFSYRVRLLPRRARTVAQQRRHQVTTVLYKISNRSAREKRGGGSWRRDLPEQHKFEAALGSLIDHLQPELIHAHDIFHLGVAARAKARAQAAGHDVRLVYDAQEFIAGLPSDQRRRAAFSDLEAEYIAYVDAVLTVSQSLGDLLNERYKVRPSIVMNAPDTRTAVETEPVRNVAAVPINASLLIYVGGLAPHRGAETLLEAMNHLPRGTHLVFVTNSTGGYVNQLADLSVDKGIGSLVHFAPFVEPEAVVSYISSADVSVIPLSREVLNYEVALPNKLFQSLHAGVPVAVSDNPEMARFVRQHELGEVFEGGNARSLANAVSRVLASSDVYRKRLKAPHLLTEFSWERQAEKLIAVYESLGVEVK